eukprot:98195-Pelagomonas_calceolata.AAC.5
MVQPSVTLMEPSGAPHRASHDLMFRSTAQLSLPAKSHFLHIWAPKLERACLRNYSYSDCGKSYACLTSILAPAFSGRYSHAQVLWGQFSPSNFSLQWVRLDAKAT